MIDQESARALAREGFDLWQAGRLTEAAVKYAEANRIADPNHWARAAYHGEYSCVLDALGLPNEAEQQARLAIEVEQRQGGLAAGVHESRMYAEMLIKHGKAQQALLVLESYIEQDAVEPWSLLFTQAKAFHAVGDRANARASAMRCVSCAPSEEKRNQLRKSLKSQLDDGLSDLV